MQCLERLELSLQPVMRRHVGGLRWLTIKKDQSPTRDSFFLFFFVCVPLVFLAA
jgi:hypothetical protein